jgi:hypothetical protein
MSEDKPARGMSGARADFIASLGKRIAEARELLAKLESNLAGTGSPLF